MSYMTVLFTDNTLGPFRLSDLFAAAAAGNTIPGVTLTPSSAGPPALPRTPPRIAKQLIMQADAGNSDIPINIGTDASMLPTAGGGIGASLIAGQFLTLEDAPLDGVYISCTQDTEAALNIIVQGGFQ